VQIVRLPAACVQVNNLCTFDTMFRTVDFSFALLDIGFKF